MYLTLLALDGRKKGKVIVPDIACPTVANVCLFAGYTPVFCDVEPATACMAPAALERLLGNISDVVAVILIHLYGQPADIRVIEDIAKRHNVPVLEDVAQAIGARLDGCPLGSFGHASFLSFGHTKILDLGGGGAVLTDDTDLYERIHAILPSLPAYSNGLQRLGQLYRSVYYSLMEFAEEDERLNALFLGMPEGFRDLYLFQLDAGQAKCVEAGLEQLSAAVEDRCRKAALYDQLLAGADVTPLKRHETGAPWRYSLLLPEGEQKRITELLRERGIDASNWYPPLHQWYASGRDQDPQTLQNAMIIGRRVLNLWVTSEFTVEMIEFTCRELRQLVDR